MTQLTPGKRYRLTFEGTASPDYCLTLTSGLVLGDLAVAQAVETVALPDPLPTTPGSIVRTSHGKTYVLLATEDGLWPWLNIAVEDDFVAVDYFKADTTVLFDAGAERA